MTDTKEKYINPYTDFGFKKLSGEEAHKDLLLDFLNELLRDEQGVITYNKTKQFGARRYDPKAVSDIFYENQAGEMFIVEMQKAKQQFFKDRPFFLQLFQ